MSKLWRTASYLFWQYPKLWLPVLAAEVASYCVRYLQQAISHQIVLWVHRSGSVLSSGQDSFLNRSETMKAAMLAAPFVWGGYFISIFLYTCALLATARILSTILNPGDSGFTVQSRIVKALKFSLKCLGLCAACAILLMFPITILAAGVGPRSLLMNPFFTGAITLLLSCAVAFIMAPHAVTLVSVAPIKSPPDQAASWLSVARDYGLPLGDLAGKARRRLRSRTAFHRRAAISRVSACLASAVSIALSLAVPRAHISGWNFWPHYEQLVRIAINVAASVAIALPYIPLFIALYLIANGASEIPGDLQSQTDPAESAPSGNAPV